MVARPAHQRPVSLALLPVLCADPVVLGHIAHYRTAWQHVQPALSGDDLRRLGIARGVIYRTILHALRMGRIDGEIHSRAQEEAIALAMAALT